ncbi:SEA (Seh1-associated) complex subunit [Coemansia sp. RSA 1358]|uniref:SEA (Seh1-associated) complex subunit n=1 Tax=Coemansia umbellata TaxID=1424467 RepID=A0ABQ8PDC4_9FUNG|nr:SEA (Seh1-associated) complex subunit [Coemansia umbellata]KAJ2618806.1 SEA (Seh1-associated) complex subunit [Coemansia sp. RSA 1358]
MSHQRQKGSGTRRNFGKSGKKHAPDNKHALEPLPEIPDNSATEDNVPKQKPSHVYLQSRESRQPKTTESRRDAIDGFSQHHPAADNEIHNSSNSKAPKSATIVGKRHTSLLESGDATDTVVAQLGGTQRPRSRTASPWRGRGRSSGGIFLRHTNHRQNANRRSLGSPHSLGQSSDKDGIHGQADDTTLSPKNAPASAGAIQDRSSNSSNVHSPAANSVTAVSKVVAKGGQSSAYRRRGHTLDPEQFATRNSSPDSADESRIEDRKEPPDTRATLSAVTPHFRISTGNTSLVQYENNQHSQTTLQQPQAKPAKMDSGSSASTVPTVELQHSPQTSIHSVDQLNTAPRGQLSKMLYKETPNSNNSSNKNKNNNSNNNNSRGSQIISEPDAQKSIPRNATAIATSTAAPGTSSSTGTDSSFASTGVQPVNAIGRTKRGGSGGESRLSDYKGALIRPPPPQSVFGSRVRQVASDIGHAARATDEHGQRADIMQSGSVEVIGAYMSQSSASELAQHALRQSQTTTHNMQTEQSPGDGPWELANNANVSNRSTVRDFGKDALVGTLQSRNGVQHGRQPKALWLHNPLGERHTADGSAVGVTTGSRQQAYQTTPRSARMPTTPAATNTNFASAVVADGTAVSAAGVHVESPSVEHQRHTRAAIPAGGDSLHNRRTSNANTRALPINIDGSVMLPSANNAGSSTTFNGSGKITSGTDSGKIDSIQSRGYSNDNPLRLDDDDGGADGSLEDAASPNPWSFVPPPGKKRTLKYHYSGRWNSIAAAPYNEPVAAVAGREGLFVFSMGPDKIAQKSFVSSGRRRSMAIDFKDVIWRPSDYIITGSNDGTVSIWDPARRNDQMVRKYNESSRPVNRLTHKPGDPYFVYSAFSDGSIVGWDVRAQSRNASIRITGSLAPQDIHCNPQDPNMIGAITQEGRINVWDIRKNTTLIDSITAHSACTGRCLAWHPNGRFIASSGTDMSIKIWDIKSNSASKRDTGTAFCTIKTFANVHKLQWRPGYDTQISSCAFVNEHRLHVWDMHNPNHSLLYHDKHSEKITGFTWYDENIVWSVGRDSNIIQCDMSSDSVYTSGLLGNTVADFSPSAHFAIATGSSSYDHDICFESAGPRYIGGPSLGLLQRPPTAADGRGNYNEQNTHMTGATNSGKSGISTSDMIKLSLFQTRYPESFVDEHELDPSIKVNSNGICKLARNYRYDPNAFQECCEGNAKAAAALGLTEVAKFWQFLSVSFGDALPLEPKRKSKATREPNHAPVPNTQPKSSQHSPSVKELPQSNVMSAHPAEPEELGKGFKSTVDSVPTSRSSSGMYASKAVLDALPKEDSSDDEPHSKHVKLQPIASVSRHSSNASLAPTRHLHSFSGLTAHADRTPGNSTDMLQKQSSLKQGTIPAKDAKPGQLERSPMSQSHSNLQHVAVLSGRKARLPSPFTRTAAHSMSNPSSNFASEPVTPLHKTNHPALNDSNGHHSESSSLATQQATNQSGYSKGASISTAKNYDTLSHSAMRKLTFQSAPGSGSLVGHSSALSKGTSGSGFNGRSSIAHSSDYTATADVLPAARLQIKAQKRITKAELTMAINSCQYYADKGDVQTAVTAALLLRNFIRLSKWSMAEHWFCAYMEQLDMFQEYSAATEILLASPFEAVREPILVRNIIVMDCSHCGAQLTTLPDVGISHCAECQRKSNSCIVCHEPVRGLFIWCQGCGHGGHADHMNEWFENMQQADCPSGCGHSCQLMLSSSPH